MSRLANRTCLVTLVISLAACSSAGKRADDEVAFLKANNGTPREICSATRRASEAYARDQDAQAFERAQIAMGAACSTVDTFPAYADTPGGIPKATDAEIAEQLAQSNTASR